MGKTNFDRITASPEALASFLASLPCLDAPWDDDFHRIFCDNCPMEYCPKVCPRGAGGIRVMEVTVNMRAEEFKEFMAWKKDRERYTKEMAAKSSEWEIMAKKVTWAIEEDPKRPGKVKIVDQEHAAELLELANDYLSYHKKKTTCARC